MKTARKAPKLFGLRLRRAALAMLIVSGLYLLAVSPVKSYLYQREQLQQYEQKTMHLDRANAQLNERIAQLQSDSEIERLARDQYELVPRGMEAYAVMPPATHASSK